MKKNRLLLFTLLIMFVLSGCSSDETQLEDVTTYDWFYQYVVAGLRFGVITPKESESSHFEPDRDVTQGEFITMLGRLHEYGHGAIVALEEGPVYERYIAWALANEIIHRYKYWDLMPCAPLTREQKAMIICRYICIFNLFTYFVHEYHISSMAFWDYYEMSYWARGPVESLRYLLLVYSRYGRYFVPHATSTRAEAVAIISGVGSAIYDLVHPLPR